MPSNDFTNLSERPVDRRTLIKAGVWAAPVVIPEFVKADGAGGC